MVASWRIWKEDILTIQSDFSAEEWNIILQAPALAGIFVLQADVYSPDVVYLKMLAALTVIVETVEQGSGNELIQAVAEAVRAGQQPQDPWELPKNLVEAREMALEGCRRAAALLGQKAPDAETTGYLRWLITIARNVARVPNEHWIMGNSSQGTDERACAALETLVAVLDAD